MATLQLNLFTVQTLKYETYERELWTVMYAPVEPSRRYARAGIRDGLVLMLRDAAARRKNRQAVRLLNRIPDPVSYEDVDRQIAILEEIVIVPGSDLSSLAELAGVN
jgi:hypothetical protein